MKRRNFIGSLFAAGGELKNTHPDLTIVGEKSALAGPTLPMQLQQLIAKSNLSPEEVRGQFTIKGSEILLYLENQQKNVTKVMDTSKLAKVVFKNGQGNVYMPDGTKIPEQVDLTLTIEQPLDAAVNKPAFCYVNMRMLAVVVDSAEQEDVVKLEQGKAVRQRFDTSRML